jgi:hypothetical protein
VEPDERPQLYDFPGPLLERNLGVGHEAVRLESPSELAETALHDRRSLVTVELQTAPAQQFLLPEPSLSSDLLRVSDQRQTLAFLPRLLKKLKKSRGDLFRQLKSHDPVQRRILHPAEGDSQHQQVHV